MAASKIALLANLPIAVDGGPLKTWLKVAVIGFCIVGTIATASARPPTATTLAVTLNGSPVTAVDPDSVITLTATVMSGGTPVTPGQVNFCDASVSWCTDIHLLGMAQLSSAGTATFKFVPGIGVHVIKAVFLGTNAAAASASAVSTLTVVGTSLPWSFGSPYNFSIVPTDPAPQAAVIADFNGDGKPDLAVSIGDAGAPASSVDVFLGNGDGTFQAAPPVPSTHATAGSLIAGDFNGDGKQDLAVVLPDVNQIQILLGNGDGTFTLGQNLPDLSTPFSIVTGDFNGDGIADLAVVNPGGNNVVVLLGNGDGTFTQAAQSPTFVASPISAAVGDFNGDGNADLAVAIEGATSNDNGSINILLGNGDGTFTPVTQTLTTTPSPTSITAAYFTENGILDLAVASFDNSPLLAGGSVTVLAGNGNGTFTPIPADFTGVPYNSITFGSLRNAGDVDLYLAGESASDAATYFGQQNNGLFNYATTSWGGTSGSPFVAVGDFNGDGFADLATELNTTNSVLIYTSAIYGASSLAATTTALTAVPTSLIAGQTLTLTATVTASSGATPSGTVAFLNGVFTLGTANLNASGVATLSLSPAAGAYSVTAGYGGSSADAPSVSAPPIAVNVGSLVSTSTSLQASATTLAVGQAVTLTATVTATGGSISDGSVTFFNGAAPLGTVTLNAQGVGAIHTSLLPPGANSITAAYVGDAEFAASTSPPLTVTVNANTQAATATELAITSGGNAVTQVVYGNAIELTATVTANGAPVAPGQVEFCDATVDYCTDIHLLGVAQLSAAGTATITLIPAVGPHSYKAVFLGTNTDQGSSSSVSTLAVTPPVLYPTTTDLTASGNPGDYTLTATITGGHPVPPTGTVTFIDTTNTNYVLGTAPVSEETALFALSFFEAGSPQVSGFPTQSTVADYNADGKPDLALLGNGASLFNPNGQVDLMLGNGGGTFGLLPNFQPLVNASAAVAGDFNGDGKVDLAAMQNFGTSVDIQLGNGDGTFTTGQTFQIPIPGGQRILTADFNGDGIADLAVLLYPTGGPNDVAQCAIFFGHGDGTFAAGPPLTLTGQNPSPVDFAVGDFNGDGKSDLAVMDNNYSDVTIYLGNGDGTFTPVAPTSPTGNEPNNQDTIIATDFNGDGILDLAVVNVNSGNNNPSTVEILLGNGDGTFTQTPVSPVAGPATLSLAVGDFNGDGKADLVAANVNGITGIPTSPGTINVLLGNGDGTFVPLQTIFTGGMPEEVAAADFNNDGLSDIAEGWFAPPLLTEVNILLAEQAGTIVASATATGISIVGTGTHWVEAVYSGDSYYAGSISQAIPLTAEPVTTTLSLSANPTAIIQGQNVVLTATLNPFQAQNHTASGNVTFYAGATALGTGAMINGVATLNTTSLPAGVDSITAVYPGDANFSAATSPPVTVTVIATTTTTLVALPTSLIVGQTLTLAATVTPGGGATPVGTVTFFNGAVSLGSAALNANGAATLTLMPAQGIYSITAAYGGSTMDEPSVSSPPVTVTVASPTTTTLIAAPTTLNVGQTLTLTATVIASVGSVPTGTVTFLNGATSLGTATLNAGGIATLTLTPPVGAYSITASYGGVPLDAPSVSSPPVSVTVKAIVTTTTLTAVPTTLNYGQTLTLTATVTAASGVIPTGTVSFITGTTTLGGLLGTATLNASGVATLVLTPAVGVYSITASYGGSATDAPSVSTPPIPVTVSAAVTATTLTAVPTALIVGQTLTLTAATMAVTGGTPTGIVTFRNGATSLGTAALNAAGVATLTLTPPFGVYSITASYPGSTTDAPSASSPPITVTVAYPPTATMLIASPNPAPYQATVIFSTTVSSPAGTPTGPVSFYDGTTLLGSATLASGAATYSTSSLSVGSHNITAQYPGVTGFSASTSNVVVEVISLPAFSISASPASRSVYTGETASYTVTVAPGPAFTLPVSLTCGQLAAGATCTFSPTTITGGSGSANLVVQTTAPSQAATTSRVSRPYRLVALAGLLLLFIPRRWRRFRNRWPMFLAILACLIAGAAFSGCGGPISLSGGTPAGAQTITINGTVTYDSQTLTHSTTVTLNVKSLF
jgi:Bacterial Ig-like domain (group 3)/FG-GAP-like repeat/FG-GAP repeat